MKYFSGCTTVEAAKRLYRELAMKWHPDRGGDTATMQEINAQYHSFLTGCDGEVSVGSDKQNHTYHYNRQYEQAVRDKISEVFAKTPADVEVWIIRTWIWLTGKTKPVKDTIKSLGFFWNQQRVSWSWHPYEWHGRHSRGDLTDLAYRYGATRVARPQEEALAA